MLLTMARGRRRGKRKDENDKSTDQVHIYICVTESIKMHVYLHRIDIDAIDIRFWNFFSIIDEST